MQVLLSSEKDTQELAETFAPRLEGGHSVALLGGLGAGKTTFVRYLVQSLGCVVQASSPTFVLCHEYETGKGMVIEHWDLYRLSSIPDELLAGPQPGVIRLIEWADKFPEILGACEFELRFELLEESKREVRIRGASLQ